MQKLFLSFVLLFITSILSAQEAYMDDIVNKTCDCISEAKIKNPNPSKAELGICVMLATKDYKEELTRDYNIDWELGHNEGERLGRIIGVQLISVCPEVILSIVEQAQEQMPEEITSLRIIGRVQRISNDQFIVFDIQDTSNRTDKYYWLTFIDTEFDLQNDYLELEGKLVEITYFTLDFYDARIKEYRPHKIIDSLKFFEQ